jgi:hypothetical protein
VFTDRLDETAMMLRRLSNNREFLAEHMRSIIRAQESFSSVNQYTSQAFVLHKSTCYSLRAVVWEPSTGRLGEELFAYGFPHDHDFSFFTVGYLGPGYRTRVYEYDYASIIGVPGEPVDLRPQEDTILSPGKVMMFRRSVDVHMQFPPESLSISFNIIQNPAGMDFRPRQYQFDVDANRVGARINIDGPELLIKLGGALGGACVPLLEEATRSESEVARAAAIESLARHVDRKWLKVGQRDASPFVRETSRILEREFTGGETNE